MYQIEVIDGRNINYKYAFEISRVRMTALAEDLVQQTVTPQWARVDSKTIPPICEYEALRAKIKTLEHRIRVSTASVHVNMLDNPRRRAYILVDAATHDIVACAEFILPSYIDAPFKVSILRKAHVLLLKVWYYFSDFFNPTPSLEVIGDEYNEAAKAQGLHVSDLEKRIKELQNESYDALKKTIYPEDLSYYLMIFGVRPDYHGKGLGRKLLLEAVEKLREEAVKPPMFNGPAKIELQSAPLARNFYRKVGCIEGPSTTTSRGLEHTTFFMNID